MYPQRELTRLAGHKAALLHLLARQRIRLVEAAGTASRPFARLERVLAFWRRIAPFALLAGLPLGLLVKRTVSPHLRTLGSLLRWSPLVLRALRGLGTAAAAHRRTPVDPRRTESAKGPGGF